MSPCRCQLLEVDACLDRLWSEPPRGWWEGPGGCAGAQRPGRALPAHALPHVLAPGPRARSRPALGASGGRSGRLDSDGIKAVHRPGVEAGDAGEMTQEHWPQAEPFRASQPWAGHGAGHVLRAARAEGIEGQTPASDTRSPGQPRRGPRCSGADSPPPPRGTSSVSPRPTPGPRVLSTSSLPAPTRPTGPIREPPYSPQSRGTSRASQEPSCVPAAPRVPTPPSTGTRLWAAGH